MVWKVIHCFVGQTCCSAIMISMIDANDVTGDVPSKWEDTILLCIMMIMICRIVRFVLKWWVVCGRRSRCCCCCCRR